MNASVTDQLYEVLSAVPTTNPDDVAEFFRQERRARRRRNYMWCPFTEFVRRHMPGHNILTGSQVVYIFDDEGIKIASAYLSQAQIKFVFNFDDGQYPEI